MEPPDASWCIFPNLMTLETAVFQHAIDSRPVYLQMILDLPGC